MENILNVVKRSRVSMDAAGTVAMFKRSWSDRGLRYVKYLGDGDSKGFIKVSECKSYGGNVKIENGIEGL